MSLPRAESSTGGFRRTRAVRWLLPAALLALMPKCVVCVLAYVGVGTALGFGGAEWCRVAESGSMVSWVTAFAWIGVVGVIGGLGMLAICRRVRAAATGKSSEG